MKKVAIQGLGFVGSAMATVVSSISDSSNNPKFQVVGIDLNNHAGLKRIDCINKGEQVTERNYFAFINSFFFYLVVMIYQTRK